MSPLFPRLNLIVLRSLDMSAAVSFYQLLGLGFESEKHSNGPEHYSCQIVDTVFEIYPASSETDVDRTTRIGFELQELLEMVTTLRTQGHTIAQEPKASVWGLRAVVVDPDGRSVELLQTVMMKPKDQSP